MSGSADDAPPDGPAPSYSSVTGTTSHTSRATHDAPSSHLQVPKSANGIPPASRRSMEDENRPLPPGWIRQWDSKEHHQFFVDTKAKPPRSIWHHPYDDDQYLSTLSSEERERIQEETAKLASHHHLDGDSTDDERPSASKRMNSSTTAPEINMGGSANEGKGLKGFGRRFKDKVTGSTHEEREARRAQREEEERQYYEAHMAFRKAMDQAMRTGQPVFLAKDKDGKDVYVEPPGGMGPGGYGASPGGYGGGPAGFGASPGYGGMYSSTSTGRGAYGVNPYASGPYADPNARFVRPSYPYSRPYGYGYGGGMGMPLAGGLMGGMLLGGLLF